MIGFQLQFKHKTVTAALEQGIVTIIADQLQKGKDQSSELNLSSLNTTTNESLVWLKEGLKVGDEFSVKLVDTEKVSDPISIKKRSPEISFKSKLNTYHKLKEELGKVGLI